MAGRIFAALLLFATIAVAAGCKRASPLPPNVSRLLAELRSPDLRRRQDAAVALGKVHPMPPEAIKALAAAVKTEEAVRTKTNSGCEKLFGIPGILPVWLKVTGRRRVDAAGGVTNCPRARILN
jgi:hypothetical protein